MGRLAIRLLGIQPFSWSSAELPEGSQGSLLRGPIQIQWTIQILGSSELSHCRTLHLQTSTPGSRIAFPLDQGFMWE